MDRIRNVRVARVSAWTTCVLNAGFVAVNVGAVLSYGWSKVWPNLLVTAVMFTLSAITLWALGAFNSHRYNEAHKEVPEPTG